MHKDILRAMAGIEVFPVISLCLFVAVFAVVLFRTLRLDRDRVARYARLPLEPEAKPDGGPTL
jgi:hypothetical protein